VQNRHDTAVLCELVVREFARANDVTAHVVDTKEQYVRKEYVMPTYSNVSQVQIPYPIKIRLTKLAIPYRSG
jgi:hypothetical protein